MKHAGVFTLGCEITDPAGRASIEVLAEQELQVEMVERQAELYQREDLRRCTAALLYPFSCRNNKIVSRSEEHTSELQSPS